MQERPAAVAAGGGGRRRQRLQPSPGARGAEQLHQHCRRLLAARHGVPQALWKKGGNGAQAGGSPEDCNATDVDVAYLCNATTTAQGVLDLALECCLFMRRQQARSLQAALTNGDYPKQQFVAP